MKIQVKSKDKIFQTINHGMCFVNREMIAFNQDLVSKNFTSIVKETAFKFVTKFEIDEEGNDTEVTYEEKTYVQDIRVKAHKISYAQADGLFTSINNDILASSESFVSEYDGLKLAALLIDTKGSEVFSTLPEDWELDLTNQ